MKRFPVAFSVIALVISSILLALSLSTRASAQIASPQPGQGPKVAYKVFEINDKTPASTVEKDLNALGDTRWEWWMNIESKGDRTLMLFRRYQP
jgi:hypothetical protein